MTIDDIKSNSIVFNMENYFLHSPYSSAKNAKEKEAAAALRMHADNREDTSDKLKEVIRNIEANRQNDPPEQGRGRNHTGCIYSELHNRGRRKNSDSGLSVSHKPVKGVGLIDCYKYRWVAEITIGGQRHRCRSAHFDVVRNWLEGMKARCS